VPILLIQYNTELILDNGPQLQSSTLLCTSSNYPKTRPLSTESLNQSALDCFSLTPDTRYGPVGQEIMCRSSRPRLTRPVSGG
jgi:hypothetical protein